MLFINFNSTCALVPVSRSIVRHTNNRVPLIAAPVYDQDTTQIAEYDGGMYIAPAFYCHLINRHAQRDINCVVVGGTARIVL